MYIYFMGQSILNYVKNIFSKKYYFHLLNFFRDYFKLNVNQHMNSQFYCKLLYNLGLKIEINQFIYYKCIKYANYMH